MHPPGPPNKSSFTTCQIRSNTNPNENNYVESDCEYFATRGLAQSIVQRTALEYAKLKSNTHVMCLFPIAHTRMAEVMNIIETHSNIFYKSSEAFNSTGQLGLIKEIYLSDGWGTEKAIRKKCKQCFRGMSQVTFVLLDAKILKL